MLESVTLNFGESRKICILVESTIRRPFEVTDAAWKLMIGSEVEANGTCEVSDFENNPTKQIVSAFIQPMRKCATYDLVYTYKIENERIIYKVRVRTV